MTAPRADPGFRIGGTAPVPMPMTAPAAGAAAAPSAGPPGTTSYPAQYRQSGAVSGERFSAEKFSAMVHQSLLPGAWMGNNVPKMQRSLAWGFTLCLFAIYAAPTIIGLRLGSDPDNTFWIGSEGMIFAALPVIFVLQHVAHMFSLQTSAPKASLLFWCAAIPAIMCACVGGFYMVEANYLYGQLNAPGCAAATIVPGVNRLEKAYSEASEWYSKCYWRLYELNGNTTAFDMPRLQDCEEWEEALNVNHIRNWKGYPTGSNHMRTEEMYAREWTYLASMEMNHDCGSFCGLGRQLWTGGPRRATTCSSAVAVKMLVTEHQGLVLLWMGLISIIVLIPGFMMVKPMLAKLGYA